MDTRVNLCGLELDNPVVGASGTFGYGDEIAALYDINCLGAFSFKGTTLEPRFGNPTPRIAECRGGLINSVGLQNPGVEYVASTIIPHLRTYYHKPVIANVSGFSVDEYVACCHRLDPLVDLIEVNISCPNVHNGGMSFGTDPRSAATVTEAVKRVTTKPIAIKLTPNVTDITAIARACEDAGADALTLINTMLGMRIDTARRRAVVANKVGGFSGGAIFPVALRMVYQTAQVCHIPIIGCGGVESAADVVEMMMAGAVAVEVGSANLHSPYACRDIVASLTTEMERLGIDRLSDIVGVVE